MRLCRFVRKYLSGWASLLVLATAPSLARADTSVYQLGLSINLGVTLATDEVTDGTPLAWTGTFEYRNTLNLGWRVLGGGTRFHGSDLTGDHRAGFLDGALMWYPTKYQAKRPQWVYFTAGVGVYNVANWLGGYNLGMGFQFPLVPNGWPYLRLEALHHRMPNGVPDAFTTVTLGLKWGA